MQGQQGSSLELKKGTEQGKRMREEGKGVTLYRGRQEWSATHIVVKLTDDSTPAVASSQKLCASVFDARTSG